MSLPSDVVGQEDEYSIAAIGGISNIIESEKNLFEGAFLNGNTSFDSELEALKMGMPKVENPRRSQEDIMAVNAIARDLDEQFGIPQFCPNDISGNFNFTTLPAPPISHSNPETPIELKEFTFDTKPTEMTRNLSEQSPLAPRTMRHLNSAFEVKPINQHQVQSFFPASTNSSRVRDGPSGLHSRANSISSLAPSTPLARPLQAGPDLGARYEPAARQSHMRTQIGPSNLRNSYSAFSDGSSLPQTGSNNQPVQAVAGNNSIREPLMGYQNHYSYEFGSYSPLSRTRGGSATPYHNQVHGNERTNDFGQFTPPISYNDPFNANSQHTMHPSRYSDQGLHGLATEGNINLHRRSVDLSVHNQPFYPTPPSNHRPSLPYDQQVYHTMKRAGSLFDSASKHIKYRSLEDARKEKTVSTHNPSNDITAPTNDSEDCHYVDLLMEAMLDMSAAEDNDGMKRTWQTMMRDQDKVEKAAWEILSLCKERHLRNGPFEMSPKVSRQFEKFEDRVRSICDAVKTQKTMCKHLLRQPFIEEVVEDPVAAVSRIKNNRKVNHGKKEAIDKGREALGEKGHGKGRRTTKVANIDSDEEFDGEYEELGSHANVNALVVGLKQPSASRSRVRRRAGSSDNGSLDQSYREGSVSKKPKRANRSVYQLNERNEMVDTSLLVAPNPQPGLALQSSQQFAVQQSQQNNPHDSYGWANIGSVTELRVSDPLFASSANIEFGGHQQTHVEGRRKVAHR